ncbi:MAG: hypothetical protein ACYC6F_17550 [Longimicrobiales bacterium]
MVSVRGVAISIGIVSLLSCGGEGIVGVLPEASTPEGIQYEVHDTLYSRGDTVTLMLTNSTDRQLGYNLCVGDLELWDGKEWHRVRKMPENSECIVPLYLLTPGDSARYLQPVFDFIEMGIYRFRDSIEWFDDGGRVEIISNGFRVTR